MKGKFLQFACGVLAGAALFGGASTVAAGIVAEPSWSPIYVDGQQAQMTAYNIGGNNYVKLRDIGKAVGFNVYFLDGVQVDSKAPYTGEAPAQAGAQRPTAASADSVRVNCYKDGSLSVGEDTALMIYPSGVEYTVVSDHPAVAVVEQVKGFWKVNALSPGEATITATAPDGRSGRVTVTVETTGQSQSSEMTGNKSTSIDLTANMEIRQEMIRLINQTRRANGVAELTVNEALMNAAQDCSAQMFRTHHTEYECKAAMAYGYPHGFGDNLTWFTGAELMKNVAQTAVTNWTNSPGHFQAMVSPRCDTIGVGVTIRGEEAFCYMFAGDPNSHHPYE